MRARSTHSRLAVCSVVGLAVVVALLAPACSQASIVFSESFNTDTANALVTYPAFTLSNGTSASVSGGVLNLIDTSGTSYTVDNIPLALPTKFLVKGDVGGTSASVSIGSDAAGLRLGNYTFIFFPGYPLGALQIRTIDGFGAPSGVVVPDQNFSFTPALNVLHPMQVQVDGQDFTIKITNGLNPLQTSTFLFTPTGPQPAYVPGRIGFTNLNGFTGLYDNFLIDDLIQVPEPSTLALLGLGAIGLAIKSRRRRTAA